MQMIFEDKFGIAMEFGDPQEQTVGQEARLVEVYLGKASDPYGSGSLVGTAMIGSDFVMPYNPDIDQDLRVYVISIGEVDGKRSDGQLRDAVSKLITIQRATEAPTVGQHANATDPNLVLVGVNFDRHARLLKVEVANTEDMAGAQVTIYNSAELPGNELPRVISITRVDGVDPLDKFVRVSQSSGGAYTPTSEVLPITFADADGEHGSHGSFDPLPQGHFELEEL